MVQPTMAWGKKNARRRKAWIFFEDESGFWQRPSIRRTWAPKGEPPILIHAFNWKKMSICAAVGYRWDGKRTKLFFQTRDGSYNSPSLIQFLKDLKRELRGQKAILVWDTGAQEPRDESVPGTTTQLAHRRRTAWVCAGPESGGDVMGKYQRARTGQSLRQRSRGSRPSATWRDGTGPQIPTTPVFVPQTRGSLFLTQLSLYYARFYKTGILVKRVERENKGHSTHAPNVSTRQ